MVCVIDLAGWQKGTNSQLGGVRTDRVFCQNNGGIYTYNEISRHTRNKEELELSCMQECHVRKTTLT